MLSLWLSFALALPPTVPPTVPTTVPPTTVPPTVTPATAPATAPTTSPLPAGKRRVLVLDFKSDGVDEATTRTLNAIVANAFARSDGLLVTSGADLRAAVDVEATRQTVSCADDSCFADLAGALGAQLVVSGSVGKLGDLLVVTVSLYDAVLQASAAKRKIEDRDLAALSPKLDAAVDEMLGVQSSVKPAPSNTAAFVVIGSGVALVVAGGVTAAAGYVIQEDPKSPGAQKAGAALAYPIGLATVGGGVAVVVVGGILLGLGASE